MRLEPRLRFAVYAAFALLVVTGIVWLVADALKDGPSSDLWQAIAANLLMIHGGAAMVTLMLLGALVPLHVRRAWRSKRNRPSGSVMASINAVLICTAFGLYYLGSDAVRPWMSDVHIGFGLLLPVWLLLHLMLGRRTRPPAGLPGAREMGQQ